MAERRVERRRLRPYHGFHLWKVAFTRILRELEAEIATEKKLRERRGTWRHPRRLNRLRAQASVLYELRCRVRGAGRLDAAAQAERELVASFQARGTQP